jgi:hypothetical protein
MAIMLSLAIPINSEGAAFSSISGIVYVDLSGDGTFQTGDWGVRNALLELYNQNNQLAGETRTNVYGQYSFADLPSGTYTLMNTTPSSAGNTANIGQIMDASNNVLVTGLGTPNSALVQISNIVLDAGYQAQNYNFGNDQYPIQLYSKYMLTNGNQIQPVPEPALFMQLLTVAGTIGGWLFFRRLRTIFQD